MHQPLKLAVWFATWRSTNICLPNTLPSTSRWASFLNSKPCSNEQKLYSPRYSFGRAIGLFSAILQTCISHFFSSEHEKKKTTSMSFQKQNRKYHSIKWLQSEFLRGLSCQLIGTNHPRCYHFEFCTWLSTFSSLQHRGYLNSVPIWGFLLIQSYFEQCSFAPMNSESLIQRELRCPLDSTWYILGE